MTGVRAADRGRWIRISLLLMLTFPALSAEIVVAPGSTVPTLSSALKSARAGDRIIVRSGTYAEPPLVIDFRVEIVGEGSPVLDGGGSHQIMTIRADSVFIRGLTFQNTGISFVEDRAAIEVKDAAGCRIEGNRFLNTFFAVYLSRASHTLIRNNRIRAQSTTEASSGNGIHLWYSRDIQVEGNEVEGHRDGIYFEFVQSSTVTGNHSRGNLRYGLHFMFSDNCRYRANRFAGNGAGVAVMYTRSVTMEENIFENNWGSASYGLLLKDITDSRIVNNRFSRNSTAIYAENSSRLDVSGNRFLDNGWAIRIMANCMDNRVQGNNFSGNTLDVATNSRSNFSDFSGNYWDRYAGYDLDRDGKGDIPFRPVTLFSFLVQKNPPVLVLNRSLFVRLLDSAESIFPVLTPPTLADASPAMRPFALKDTD